MKYAIPHIEHVVGAIKFAAFLNTKGEDANEKGTHGVMASHALWEHVTYSCLYARALDRFLFENDAVGAVLHQGLSRKQMKKSRNPQQADIPKFLSIHSLHGKWRFSSQLTVRN